jgi:OHCU decarboxylase
VTLDDLNRLDRASAEAELLRCCGSTRWAQAMAAARPFASVDALMRAADAVWASLDPADWLEAFAAHPKIGGKSEGAKPGWSGEEQAGVRSATDEVRSRLADRNREYDTRFGYIFIVCATGKSAGEMLAMLEQRLTNDAATELRLAAEEQRKITRLRIGKLVDHT